jgi:catechol 2,3-dioxygenase-like lactoylglutathione lyase family enzyme
MKFASIRIITSDIQSLIAFYEKITGLRATHFTEDFAVLQTSTITVAISTMRPLQLFGAENLAIPASNHSVILEFFVDDVDAEFEKLKVYLGDNIVQIPTTMPWGNRSMLFRDTDGNLVNFFTPVTTEAKARAH